MPPVPLVDTSTALPAGTRTRYAELDALRGIAAGVVVLFHAWMIVPWPGGSTRSLLESGAPLADLELWFRLSPLRLVTAGQAMVGLFFALSGLVLALPWVRGRPPAYAPFLVKRFCRLYLPFAAAILLAAVLASATAGPAIPGLSRWLAEAWATPVSAGLLRDHLLMRGTTEAMSLDSVMWSLVHEARYSLVFPLLVVLALARPRLAILGSLGLSAVISAPSVIAWVTRELAGPGSAWGWATVADTARYAPYFVGGILLAARLEDIADRLARLRPPVRALAWTVAGMALLTHPAPAGEVAWWAGSLALIALLVSSPRLRGVLEAAPWRWLGRVSYSLYLVHVPVLLATVHLGWGRAPLWALLAIGIVLALAAAHLMQRLVEHPCEQFGRKLAARLETPPARGVRRAARE